MIPFFKSRLSVRLIGAFVVIIATMLSVQTVMYISRAQSRIHGELAREGQLLADQLSYNSRIAVFAENRDNLRDIAAGVLSEPDVVQVGIYDDNRRLLYMVTKTSFPSAAELEQSSVRDMAPGDILTREANDTVEFVKPVAIQAFKDTTALYFEEPGSVQTARIIGYVRVVMTKESLNHQKKSMLMTNVLTGLAFIGLTIAIVFVLVRRITAPIETLTGRVQDLGRGKEIERVPVDTTDEIGRLAEAFNTMVDERVSSERALRESEKKYRELFEQSMHAVLIATPEGRIIDINPAGISLLGYSTKAELLAINLARDVYLHSEDRDEYKRLMELQGFVKDFKTKFRTKSGDVLDIVITATAVYDYTGTIVALRGMFRDETAERSLEGQLRQSQKMEAVGRLTGGVAHDFNNILTAIVSYAHHLEVKLSKREDPLETYAGKIIIAGEKAADLIRSLLMFSRKQVLNVEPVDLNELVEKHTDLLARVLGQDIELAANIADDALVISADAGQITHLLMNFASNARDAMPAGGRFTVGTARVLLDNDFVKIHGFGTPGEHAVLTAEDTGSGMDAATIKNIFEPFFTTKEQGKGTGLGLSIVYGIVKQHHGYIDVESEPMKGSTFKVYLPLGEDGNVPVAAADWDRAAEGSETILLAEDDAEVRELTQAVLSESGYKVLAAIDGEEAVKIFEDQKDSIDLVLLDMVMPRKNGMQVAVELQKIRPGLKTILISAYPGDFFDGQGEGPGEPQFMAKPVSPRKLLRKVREVLDA